MCKTRREYSLAPFASEETRYARARIFKAFFRGDAFGVYGPRIAEKILDFAHRLHRLPRNRRSARMINVHSPLIGKPHKKSILRKIRRYGNHHDI